MFANDRDRGELRGGARDRDADDRETRQHHWPPPSRRRADAGFDAGAGAGRRADDGPREQRWRREQQHRVERAHDRGRGDGSSQRELEENQIRRLQHGPAAQRTKKQEEQCGQQRRRRDDAALRQESDPVAARPGLAAE